MPKRPKNVRTTAWTAGMAIAPEHFQNLEHYFETIQAISHQLGALPHGIYTDPTENRLPEITAQIRTEGSDKLLQVKVKHCRGITPSGELITIDGSEEWAKSPERGLALDQAGNATRFDVVLSVDYEKKAPMEWRGGSVDRPDITIAVPKYELLLFPGSANDLPQTTLRIATLILEGQNVRVDPEYIPPCVSMTTHPRLDSAATSVIKSLNDVVVRSQRTIEQYYDDQQIEAAKDPHKSTERLFKCCEVIVGGVPATLMKWNSRQKELPPLEWAIDSVAMIHRVRYCAPFSSLLKDAGLVDRLGRGMNVNLERTVTELEEHADHALSLQLDPDHMADPILAIQNWASTLERLMDTISNLAWVKEKGTGGGGITPIPVDEYFYKDKRFKRIDYSSREAFTQGNWHHLIVHGLAASHAQSLLVLFDPNLYPSRSTAAGVVFLKDSEERIIIKMKQAAIDTGAPQDNDRDVLVVHLTEVSESNVTTVSLASQVVSGLSTLGTQPDDLLRVFVEA